MDVKDIFKDMTVEQFQEIKQKFDEAENDTTPFAVVDDNQTINVVGDVEKTEKKKFTYTITFYYPNRDKFRKRIEDEGREIILETDNYLVIQRTYTDVWIPPQIFTNVQVTMAEVYQFFVAATEEGDLRDLTEQETIEVLSLLSSDMIERMCHAVATIMGIPQSEEKYMYSIGLPLLIAQLAEDFPEVINGVDFFTDRSSETSELAIVEKK